MSAMEDCVLCRIVRREIPAYVLYEDKESIGILDIHPRAPGHTMVVPRVHVPRLAELPEVQVSPLFRAVQLMAERLVSRLAADGLTIGINEGSVSGQTVPHLHIHLIPRFTGDGGGSIHSVVHNEPHESIEEIAKKLII